MLPSALDLKVKTISCLSKKERLASQLSKEQAKIQRANRGLNILKKKKDTVFDN